MKVNFKFTEYPLTHSDLSFIPLCHELCLGRLNFTDNINLAYFPSGFGLVWANETCSLEIKRPKGREFDISFSHYLPPVLGFGSGCILFQKLYVLSCYSHTWLYNSPVSSYKIPSFFISNLGVPLASSYCS